MRPENDLGNLSVNAVKILDLMESVEMKSVECIMIVTERAEIFKGTVFYYQDAKIWRQPHFLG